MSGAINFGVQVTVDIYPRTGGKYTMDGSNAYARRVTTSKDIRQDYGTFEIDLSPGGPSGGSGTTWSQLIPPMSLCLISITRGSYKQTVMQGLVLSITESQDWSRGTPIRQVTLQGADLAYILATRLYYSLAALSGSPLGGLSNTNQLSLLAQGVVSGTPANIAKSWLDVVAFGTQGLLSGVAFTGPDGAIPFSQMLGQRLDEYDAPASIPAGANFIGAETSWLNKLRTFLDAPWYEVFITTSAPGYYAGTDALRPMSSSNETYDDVATTIVGRVDPQPRLVNSGTPQSPQWSVDSTLWNRLPRFTTESGSPFLESQVQFDVETASNWYFLNPTSVSNLLGGGNSQIASVATLATFYEDAEARNAYGYRPAIIPTNWLYDPSGVQSQRPNATDSFQGLFNTLLVRAMGLNHATYLMAKATVTLPLRPDVMPGTVFSYTPFKDGVPWVFYVDAVAHSAQPPTGGSTTLSLSRGLPQTVYADDALLLAVLLGQADRVEGKIVAAVHKGLQPFALGATVDSTPYSSPQGGKQPSASGGS